MWRRGGHGLEREICRAQSVSWQISARMAVTSVSSGKAARHAGRAEVQHESALWLALAPTREKVVAEGRRRNPMSP